MMTGRGTGSFDDRARDALIIMAVSFELLRSSGSKDEPANKSRQPTRPE
jgi:hypothetical protein